MATAGKTRDVAGGRLTAAEYAENFADLHPPLDAHQGAVEADRCYFCFDAPCTAACPTGIDIPMFIRQIQSGNPLGAADTILEQNVMGGMCARVCPTETLCEAACVRTAGEGKPVKIGLLQRYATDALLAAGASPFRRAAPTGKQVAVVGGGPAGLACAHRLAVRGHDVTVFEARDRLGGLNEYGIAAYKTVDDFARREVEFILSVGGIEVRTGQALGRDLTLADLQRDYDAVFLGLGLGAVNALGLSGEDREGVLDAVDYIAELRQAGDLATLPVGRRIVVVGGGMTAIDIATQTRRLGAEDVTIVYRRGRDAMKASAYEQELAQTSGVRIKHDARPSRLVEEGGAVTGVEFEYTRPGADGRLEGAGETFVLEADMVFKAIGQAFVPETVNGAAGPALANGRIAVDAERRTSMIGVWAGGDCVDGGQDLTVAAVEDGKIAATSIDRALRGRN
jgi:dihydropyrimidine dehydrogenase (NAD+) subunit PreT